MNNSGDTVLAINEDNLYQLCLEIDGYTDKIAEIFNNIDNNFNELTEAYKSDSVNALVNSYNEFRKNYAIVKNNVSSYSEDLNELAVKFKSGVKRIALSLEEDSEYVKGQKNKAIL